MKFWFLFIASLFFFENLSSQHLSLQNLITLQQKNLGDVEEYLLSKGWEFKSSAPESDTSAAITAFQNKFATKTKLAIFQFLYSITDSFTRVWYTLLNTTAYQAFIQQSKQLGFKFQKAKTESETNSTLYMKKGLCLIFRTFVMGKSPNTTNLYRIELYAEKDYVRVVPL